ncbi:MAG: hypothetical protein ACKOC8_04810 [Pirellulales bacterium]
MPSAPLTWKRSSPRRRVLLSAVVLAGSAICPMPARGIEMFTYFGDGSRIGLPNLEVPIEAYPGIPLRSDRLRARRQAMRRGAGTATPVGPGTPAAGITIRSMPAPTMPPAVQQPISPQRTVKPTASPRTKAGRPAAR